MDKIDELKRKVRERLGEAGISDEGIMSDTYRTFVNEEKEETILKTFFERYCDFAGSMLSFLRKQKSEQLEEEIEIAGLKISSGSVIAATILTVFLGFLSMLPFVVIGNMGYSFFILITFLFIAYIIYTYPTYSAEITRIKAQQESVLAMLYMTIYMRVNPVLENAILFASSHLQGPLGRDLKRIIWLLNMEKVDSIEEAINVFVPLWMRRNKDFVKAFTTLQSVLLQSTKENQERILDKALSSILNDTYEKMKHYSHDLKMPVLLINTFGLMLPLIGLIAFPMVSIFMSESISMSYIFFGYIIVLPALIQFLSQRAIAKRPGAFSAPDISSIPGLPPKNYFLLKRKDGTKKLIPLIPVAIILALIIMTPGLLHIFLRTIPVYMKGKSGAPGFIPAGVKEEYNIINVLEVMLIPIGIAVGLFILFYGRSIQKKKFRDNIIEIEDDLSVSLFQIANQFTENIPVEIGISNFVNHYEMLNLKKRQIYTFFSKVINKMRTSGKTFEQSIFDHQEGVILKYPSVLLKEIMWIITESSRKGSEVVYNILMKVSVYLDNVKKIKDLIYDLLHDTVTSIDFQAKFMAPMISAMVSSLTLVMVESLYKLFQRINAMMQSLTSVMISSSSSNFFINIINFAKITPPTLFQTLVGIYLIEAIVLFSKLSNGIEYGFDEIESDVSTARNIMTAMIIYVFLSVIMIVMFKKILMPQIFAEGAMSG